MYVRYIMKKIGAFIPIHLLKYNCRQQKHKMRGG